MSTQLLGLTYCRCGHRHFEHRNLDRYACDRCRCTVFVQTRSNMAHSPNCVCNVCGDCPACHNGADGPVGTFCTLCHRTQRGDLRSNCPGEPDCTQH